MPHHRCKQRFSGHSWNRTGYTLKLMTIRVWQNQTVYFNGQAKHNGARNGPLPASGASALAQTHHHQQPPHARPPSRLTASPLSLPASDDDITRAFSGKI
jgi:hypothetical protein